MTRLRALFAPHRGSHAARSTFTGWSAHSHLLPPAPVKAVRRPRIVPFDLP